MAGKKRKRVAAAADNGQGPGDPLAFVARDRKVIYQVRQALKALDGRKEPQAGHVRQFIAKVRNAVAPPVQKAQEPPPAA